VTPRLALNNRWRYLRSLEGLTVNGYWGAGGTLLLVVVTALAVAGYLWKLAKARRTMVEVLVPAYVVVVAVWPAFQSLRFLIVLIPFYALYALLGVRAILTRIRLEQLAPAAVATLAAVVAVSYAGVYTRVDAGPVPEGVETPQAQALFGFLRAETPADALVLFQRPKALALYTGRRSTPYAPTWGDQDVTAYAQKLEVAFIASGPFDEFLTGYAARNGALLEQLYEDGPYRVWRFTG
jgi:hypothetical protein